MIEPVVQVRRRELRAVHYLGSKLRLLDAIRSEIGRIAGPESIVCDLFSGSGTVALALSHHWRIVAADIQEYSRVLSSALLIASRLGPEGEQIVAKAKVSALRHSLDESFRKVARRGSERTVSEPITATLIRSLHWSKRAQSSAGNRRATHRYVPRETQPQPHFARAGLRRIRTRLYPVCTAACTSRSVRQLTWMRC